MEEAVTKITRDHAYRAGLEIAARQYYLDYLAPERVIQRLAFDHRP
jgi:hypothetical protein